MTRRPESFHHAARRELRTLLADVAKAIQQHRRDPSGKPSQALRDLALALDDYAVALARSERSQGLLPPLPAISGEIRALLRPERATESRVAGTATAASVGFDDLEER